MPETGYFLATARRLRGEADRMLGMMLGDAGRREYLDASRHSRPTPLVPRGRYTRLASGHGHPSGVFAIKVGHDNDVLTAKFL